MAILKDIFRLLRISQWYKNVLIFIPLVFSLNLFNFNLFLLTLLGFLALSLMSSSYYILNDLKDINKDKNHPEKKNRPLASGKIPKYLAILLFIFLFVNSLILSFLLSFEFFLIILLLFFLSQIYTFSFREIAFFDIIAISINFPVRMISGSFLINVPINYPLVLASFFLSIFLVSGKRISETYIQGLEKYRPALNKQHKDALTLMATVSVSLTTILFVFYTLEIAKPLLFLTLPISFYLILIYFNSVFHDPEKIRNPERFILDRKIIFTLLIWAILLVASLYGNLFLLLF